MPWSATAARARRRSASGSTVRPNPRGVARDAGARGANVPRAVCIGSGKLDVDVALRDRDLRNGRELPANLGRPKIHIEFVGNRAVGIAIVIDSEHQLVPGGNVVGV